MFQILEMYKYQGFLPLQNVKICNSEPTLPQEHLARGETSVSSSFLRSHPDTKAARQWPRSAHEVEKWFPTTQLYQR